MELDDDEVVDAGLGSHDEPMARAIARVRAAGGIQVRPA